MKVKEGMTVKKAAGELVKFKKGARNRIRDNMARRLQHRRMRQANAVASAAHELKGDGANTQNLELACTESATCLYLEQQLLAYYDEELGLSTSSSYRTNPLAALRRQLQSLQDGSGGAASSSSCGAMLQPTRWLRTLRSL